MIPRMLLISPPRSRNNKSDFEVSHRFGIDDQLLWVHIRCHQGLKVSYPDPVGVLAALPSVDVFTRRV